MLFMEELASCLVKLLHVSEHYTDHMQTSSARSGISYDPRG